jgi:hypothetical protein
MSITAEDLDPVAIALERIEVGADVRFVGIDVETGARMSILIEHMLPIGSQITALHDAAGLVLLLTVEAI